MHFRNNLFIFVPIPVLDVSKAEYIFMKSPSKLGLHNRLPVNVLKGT